MINLTKRQRILFERLVQLGPLIESSGIPLIVVEVLGFGSFFRGKADARDIDLMFRCRRHPPRPDFARFSTLLEKIRYEFAYQEQFASPEEAIDAAYRAADSPRLPGFDDSEVECARFRDWLHGHTWNMLHAKSIHDESRIKSPEEFTRRVVKRQLPNLNVMQFLNEDDPRHAIRCGFTVRLWSSDRPDIQSLLTEALSEERVYENTLQELRYFEKQLPVLQAEAELLQIGIAVLLAKQKPEMPAKHPYSWLEAFEKECVDLQPQKDRLRLARSRAVKFDDTERGSSVPSKHRSLSYPKASKTTEKTRKEIKGLYQRIEQLKVVQWSLALYLSGELETDHSIEAFTAINALTQGSKRERQLMESLLMQLGIPIPERDPHGFFAPL